MLVRGDQPCFVSLTNGVELHKTVTRVSDVFAGDASSLRQDFFQASRYPVDVPFDNHRAAGYRKIRKNTLFWLLAYF